MDPIKLTIDGKEVTTTKGKNVIQVAAEMGIAIPHYCYHPKLSIAGNCRMCLIEIEKMPKLQIACNTQAAEGMSVLTQSPKVLAVRKAVLEFLLIMSSIPCRAPASSEARRQMADNVCAAYFFGVGSTTMMIRPPVIFWQVPLGTYTHASGSASVVT